MHKRSKSKIKAIVVIAVAMVFVMPVASFANEESINNSEMIPEIDFADLCPLLCYDADDIDIIDTSNLGVLGDRFYGYKAYPDPAGPVYFDSENPGNITLLKETISSRFIAGGTWAEGTWYGCQYDTGWLWTIDELTGIMTLIGGGGNSLNGLAYDITTDKMYGASNTELYSVNMSNGAQALVGSLNTGGLIIGITFDGKGILYGEDLNDNLYSINPLTGASTLIGPLGINLNWAQDMAYDITWDVLYLAACTTENIGQLYTCNVTNGHCTLVGDFQGGAEITGFAIPYHPPETPERPEGPTEGVVEVAYTFSTSTTNPGGGQVYYRWDWNDGTYSEWIGPYGSGLTALASHSWTDAETYEITVKAKDVHDIESGWSDPKIIHIVDMPILEIGNITGGPFKVITVIKNNGSVGATMVNWSITLESGVIILLGKETSGRIAGIRAGEETTISSRLILGFGNTVIAVTAECNEGSSDTKTKDAFVFLFFTKI